MATGVSILIPDSTVVADFRKRRADWCVDEDSIYCYDLSNPASFPSQADAANATPILNLVEGGADTTLTTGGTANFDGGGLDFTASTGQRIALPAAAKLAADIEHFMWSIWIKPGTQSQAIFEMGGYHYEDTGPYGLRSTAANTYRLICAGKTQNFTPTNGSVQALHVALEKVDASTYLAHFFKNGVLLGSQTVTSPLQQPSTAVSTAALGDAAGTGYSGFWVGRLFRSWLTTKARTYAEILALAQEDWELNQGYFS